MRDPTLYLDDMIAHARDFAPLMVDQRQAIVAALEADPKP